MGFGKCCGTAGEANAEIEQLVRRGRRLHSRTVYETFARIAHGVGGCFGKALRTLAGGSRKLNCK